MTAEIPSMRARLSAIGWRRFAAGTMLALLSSLSIAGIDDTPKGCRGMVAKVGLPAVDDGIDVVLLCRAGFLLAHSDAYKVPLWVAERLEPTRFVGPGNRKSDCSFKADPELVESNHPAATDGDYKKKSVRESRSFDRGHMAPAADMKFDSQAMKESCLLSNIAPQQGLDLNRHIWADLEGIVRDWTCKYGELVVFTGPIYEEDAPDSIGDGVAVPTAFYKIVFRPSDRRALAFVLPNERVKKNGKDPYAVLTDYIVKPAEVQQRAGIKFFSGLERRKRNQVLLTASPMWANATGACKGVVDVDKE